MSDPFLEEEKESSRLAEMEFAVFGLIFRRPGAVAYFEEHLPPEHLDAIYGGTGLAQIYVALLDFYRTTRLDPVDPIAFKLWLDAESEVAEVLGSNAMKSLIDGAIDPTLELPTPDAVTGMLRYQARKRVQIESLQELTALLNRKQHRTLDGHQERITFLTNQIRALEEEVGYDPLSFVETGHDLANRRAALLDLPDFLPTQYHALNAAVGYDPVRGGFVRGAIYVILAASGFGKSTLARCLMTHWLDQGHTALYVNYEEPASMWERSLLISVTGRNIYEPPEPTDEERSSILARYDEKLTAWGDRFMVRHDPDTPYFEDLERWLRDVLGHNTKVPEVVIVDTLQSMFTKASGGKPRWGQYEEMMVRLEKLAKDMHCVLIITAQENTNRLKEGREVVQQSDVGGSISIAQKATVAMHLTPRRKAAKDDSIDESIMEIQISKNRITGTRYSHDPPLVRYDESTKSYLPWKPLRGGGRRLTTEGFHD